ncbi:unnamed protein product (macronuclear) [Paramecium tetraurelia]|uniref:Sugar phosphate transporter domain-containing protein n=1 Tax=Paramecium tetraurelia TaxID=5888 RepID=A0DKV9_PARTE|nr:uncharacterized protein GSPATT00017993001 [Paramecium tetraurelia]CAK83676.1 unnamed protein product [Paramecium tetraurelia]|eukprot:XP_001451073.1 hypothetical protein (macronuclear) [Paramecium tetraurelia strain d4-2]
MKHILGLFYCVLYGGCSFCFSLSVKYLWIKFQFRMTFMLLLYENILTALICLFMGKRNHSSKDTLLYSFIYSLQTFSGMKGLQIMNISMYMTLRRTLILFVFMMQKTWKISNFMSVIFITLGAIIAGQEHLDENYFGYGLILMNNLFNALALHKSKQLNYEKQIDPLELLFQNSCNQIPFLFIGAYASQELHDFMTTTYMSEQFLIAFTLVALMGFMLCYSTNLCNMYNSPIAIAITHNIKDILITSYSFFFLKEEYDFQILAGIIISYLGSILYSIQKVKEIKSLYLPLSSNDKDQKQD